MLKNHFEATFKNVKLNKVCTYFAIILFICLSKVLQAQVLYVDVVKGSDGAKGTLAAPVASLDKAIGLAKELAGKTPITIKIAPGLYVLTRQVKIESRDKNDTAKYTLEALIMPDDSAWKPSSMPVIQSVSGNNVKTYFDHCLGFEVLRNNVSIRGLKFLGNANPAVQYYYPIGRNRKALKTLEISQCLFIGERNSAPIQGAIYLEEANAVQVDHCIFYECKNGLLLFYAARDFSLTHSIIYGAYESAIWYGYKDDADTPITFHNNIVADSKFFWLGSKSEDHPLFTFNNSLITGNEHYMGLYDGGEGPKPYKGKGTHKENGIQKTGQVILNKVTSAGVPLDYLHVSPESAGYSLGAGLFKTSKSK